MSFNRINRINEEVKRELSIIIRNLKDPRISDFASVIAVDITRDLRWCKVFINVMGDEKSQKDTLAGLKSAAGFIRREIGEKVDLRVSPEILFELDHSIEHGAHINEILNKLHRS